MSSQRVIENAQNARRANSIKLIEWWAVVAQPWLARPTAEVRADDRRRLDMVVYSANPHGYALCCDATVVSPLRRNGTVHSRSDER